MTSLRRMAIPLALLAGIGLSSCGRNEVVSPKKLSPERQAFVDAYKKIQVGMSEQEVDALLRGYPSHVWPPGDDPKRRYAKSYDEKHGANESDYYILVHFDDEHVVVDKHGSEYCK